MAATKGKELSTAEKLRQLYELQLGDSELDELQSIKGELPMEVNDLEDEIVGLETRIGKAEGAVNEMARIGRLTTFRWWTAQIRT